VSLLRRERGISLLTHLTLLRTFDINSPSRNESLVEQFEIALRRTSLESTPLASATSGSATTGSGGVTPVAIIHDTSSSLSQRKRSSSSASVTSGSVTKGGPVKTFVTVAGQRYSLREGLEQLLGIVFQTIVKRKPFDQMIAIELAQGVHQIICDHIATFVKDHKDLVLIAGAPGWSISLSLPV
jgi:hypothetical protein